MVLALGTTAADRLLAHPLAGGRPEAVTGLTFEVRARNRVSRRDSPGFSCVGVVQLDCRGGGRGGRGRGAPEWGARICRPRHHRRDG